MSAPSKFKPEYCQRILSFMEKGFSLTAFAGKIGVCRDPISAWTEAHPEFMGALKKGKARAALYWERRLHTAGSRLGDTAPVIFAFKNIAPDDWKSDKQVEVHNITSIENKPAEALGRVDLYKLLEKRGLLSEITPPKEL